MTKYWTVQSREVINLLREKGIYFPNFEFSKLVNKNPEIRDVYNIILDSFNKFNNSKVKGVLFSFLAYDINNGILTINSYEEFKKRIINAKGSIKSLWDYFLSGEFVILELELPDDFNPIFIEINDFQAIMPPVIYMPPYTKPIIEDIYNSLIINGNGGTPVMPCGLIQAHIPFIMVEDITNVYPLFSLDD